MSERAPSALFDHPGEFSALSLCCGRGICIRVYEERERQREGWRVLLCFARVPNPLTARKRVEADCFNEGARELWV